MKRLLMTVATFIFAGCTVTTDEGPIHRGGTSLSQALVLSAEKLAEAIEKSKYGDIQAMLMVAKHYMGGLHEDPSGLGWWHMAAACGDTNTQMLLGLAYMESPIKAERDLGEYWLQQAIAGGSRIAQEELDAYRRGMYDSSQSVVFGFGSTCATPRQLDQTSKK